MAFERFEVRVEDASGAPVATVWGPSHSLARAREVAQRTANATGEGVRIDSVIYDHVGDQYPETDPLEFYGPDPAAADHAEIVIADDHNPRKSHGWRRVDGQLWYAQIRSDGLPYDGWHPAGHGHGYYQYYLRATA